MSNELIKVEIRVNRQSTMAIWKHGLNLRKAMICLGVITTIYAVFVSLTNNQVDHEANNDELTGPIRQLDEFPSGKDFKFRVKSVDSNIDEINTARQNDNPYRSKVIIIGYKRGGTSFFGDLLHNYPNTQYLFEPLVGIYGHMYLGKVVTPWAIRIHSNGTIRAVPEYEENYAMNQLQNLLNCNYEEIHPHVYSTDGPFIIKGLDMKCIQNNESNTHHKECCRTVFINELPNYCINPDVLPKNQDKNPDSLRSEILSMYRHFNDPAQLGKGVSECGDHLLKECENSNTIVLKLIRSRMSTAVKLLESDPDIKVIHLIRDPRAIQDSRRRMTPGYGFMGIMNISESARLLCKLMLNDSLTVQIQPPHIKNRILQIRYEDILLNKNASLRTINDFIGQHDWSPLATWMDVVDCRKINKNGTRSCTRGRDSMNKWRQNLDVVEQNDMARTCAEALAYFGYPNT